MKCSHTPRAYTPTQTTNGRVRGALSGPHYTITHNIRFTLLYTLHNTHTDTHTHTHFTLSLIFHNSTYSHTHTRTPKHSCRSEYQKVGATFVLGIAIHTYIVPTYLHTAYLQPTFLTYLPFTLPIYLTYYIHY